MVVGIVSSLLEDRVWGYSTTHFLPPTRIPAFFLKLSRRAASKTSRTPHPSLAEHSRYRLAPISLATFSPSNDVMGRVPCAAMSDWVVGSFRRSVLVHTKMVGTDSQKWAISGCHCSVSPSLPLRELLGQ